MTLSTQPSAPNHFSVKLPEGITTLRRYRAYVNGKDSRPVVWPPAHPWWESGHTGSNSIIIAYCENVEQMVAQWPEIVPGTLDSEGCKVDSYEERNCITFSTRFQPPDWWMNLHFEGSAEPNGHPWTYTESYQKLKEAGWVLSDLVEFDREAKPSAGINIESNVSFDSKILKNIDFEIKPKDKPENM